jgi:hypothetical protein
MDNSTPSQRIKLKALQDRLAKAGHVLAENIRDAKRLQDITDIRTAMVGVRERLRVHRQNLKDLAETSAANVSGLRALGPRLDGLNLSMEDLNLRLKRLNLEG